MFHRWPKWNMKTERVAEKKKNRQGSKEEKKEKERKRKRKKEEKTQLWHVTINGQTSQDTKKL